MAFKEGDQISVPDWFFRFTRAIQLLLWLPLAFWNSARRHPMQSRWIYTGKNWNHMWYQNDDPQFRTTWIPGFVYYCLAIVIFAAYVSGLYLTLRSLNGYQVAGLMLALAVLLWTFHLGARTAMFYIRFKQHLAWPNMAQ